VVHLNGNTKKALLAIAVVAALVLLFASMPNVSAKVKQIDTQITLNMPAAFPAQSSVSFSGQVTPDKQSDPAVPVGSTVTLMYRHLGSYTWLKLQTVTTIAGGSFAGTFTAPSTPGPYQFQAVFIQTSSGGSNGNCWKTSTSCIKCACVNQFVVSEYPWAGLAALFSCFGAFVVFKKRDSIATRIRMHHKELI
jgi:hypothetical protein